MRKHSTLQIFLFLMSLISFNSCGNGDKNQGNGSQSQDLELTPSEQLVGDWNGIYRALENGKPIGDASEARMSLSPEAGFSIKLGAGDALTMGEWSEFQGRSLILKISGSSIPRIGAAGKIIEPSYDLQGTNLHISNEFFELKLTKKSGESDSPSGDKPPTGSLGSWKCDDGLGRQTKLQLSQSNAFSLVSSKPGERLFYASGKVVSIQANVMKLVPSSVSDPLPTGSYFQFTRQANNSELVFIPESEGKNTSLGTCNI